MRERGEGLRVRARSRYHRDDPLPAQTGRGELRLAPGVWQARVVLTDQETGEVGSALHTFEVERTPGLE